jgi:hypothetical protein
MDFLLSPSCDFNCQWEKKKPPLHTHLQSDEGIGNLVLGAWVDARSSIGTLKRSSESARNVNCTKPYNFYGSFVVVVFGPYWGTLQIVYRSQKLQCSPLVIIEWEAPSKAHIARVRYSCCPTKTTFRQKAKCLQAKHTLERNLKVKMNNDTILWFLFYFIIFFVNTSNKPNQ